MTTMGTVGEVCPDDNDSAGCGTATGMPPSTGGWEAIVAYARELGPDPTLAHLADDDIEFEVRRTAGAVASTTARFLVLVAEFVARGTWKNTGARTPGQWLSWAVGMAPSTGREMVRVALALRIFTKVRDRFLAGTLSYSKVRAITRVGEPALEDTLLVYADNAPASQLERVVRTFRGLDRAGSAHDGRGLDVRDGDDGMMTLRVRVPREVGLALRDRLDRVVAELDASGQPHDADLDDVRGDQPPLHREPLAARRADALVHAVEVAVQHLDVDLTGMDRTTLVLHGEVDTMLDRLADPDRPAPPRPDTPNPARPDDLDPARPDDPDPARQDTPDPAQPDLPVDARAVPDGGAASGSSVSGGASAEAPRRDRNHRGGRTRRRPVARSVAPVVTDDSGGLLALSRSVLRRLSCDPSIARITTRGGLPIDVGRQTRQIPAMLRRALRARDETCRFPGCAATRHLHAHHVIHWADGGPTDLANLVLLCGAHHRLVHAERMVVDHDPDTGHTTVLRPAAHAPIPPVLAPIGSGQSASAEAAARHHPKGLQPPHWEGEPLDLDFAVSQLQWKLGRIPGMTATAA